MKIKRTFFLLLLTIIGFIGESKSPVKSCLKKLKEDIKVNWQLSKDSSHYVTNYKFLCQLDSVYKFCIIGFSPKQVIKLFGKPTSEEGKSSFKANRVMKYLTTPPPKPPNYGCANLYFEFGDNEKLIKVYELGQGVIIDD